MAEADFTVADDSLLTASIRRGVTAGITPPPGGGSFVYGFNSIDLTPGAVALFVNLTNFAPMLKGGSVRMVMKRGVSGGPEGFAPYVFIGLGGTSVNDYGYILGLSDGNPSHIVLRKGRLVDGVPDLTPALGNGNLRKSTPTVAVDEYVHLRLDMIVNLNGDVRLQMFRNDLAANPLGGSPVWAPIAGMAEFVDDALGVNSGTVPLTTGRGGFGFQSSDVTRRAWLDHFQLFRQT